MRNSVKCLLVALCLLCGAGGKISAVLGPTPMPDWGPCAQVKLGWTFADPKNPQNSVPLAGWDTYISAEAPVWAYDVDREVYEQPGQWYIQIPNLNNDHPRKLFWLCYVYERDPEYIPDAPRAFTNLDWSPDEGWEPLDYPPQEEWFTEAGTPTSTSSAAVFARVTMSIVMLPNPEYEDISIGIAGDYTGAPIEPLFGADGYDLVEVYVLTLCLPEPTVWRGLDETVIKPDYADWTLAENQDRITDSVWLTRADTQGLFNIAQETGYNDEHHDDSLPASPVCTEWAYGAAEDWESLVFEPWLDWHGWEPPSAVSREAVLHIIPENIYLDIMFLLWSTGDCDGGGGFAYRRASLSGCLPAASDANRDCYVDLEDLAIMTLEWLTCSLNDQDACWVE